MQSNALLKNHFQLRELGCHSNNRRDKPSTTQTAREALQVQEQEGSPETPFLILHIYLFSKPGPPDITTRHDSTWHPLPVFDYVTAPYVQWRHCKGA